MNLDVPYTDIVYSDPATYNYLVEIHTAITELKKQLDDQQKEIAQIKKGFDEWGKPTPPTKQGFKV